MKSRPLNLGYFIFAPLNFKFSSDESIFSGENLIFSQTFPCGNVAIISARLFFLLILTKRTAGKGRPLQLAKCNLFRSSSMRVLCSSIKWVCGEFVTGAMRWKNLQRNCNDFIFDSSMVSQVRNIQKHCLITFY